MKNLVFVIWMLGYPIVCRIGQYIDYLCNRTYSDSALIFAEIIQGIIWIIIGILLYERANNGKRRIP